MKSQSHLGEERIGKLLFSMALPAITAQIINLLYNMVDRIFIGRIPEVGAQALTGVGVTMPILMLVSAFAALVSMGAAPRASIMMGKGKMEDAEEILGNSASSLLILSLVLTAIVLVFGERLLLAFGASTNTLGYGLDYIRIYALGTIFVQLSLGLNAFITAQGFAKISMKTVLLGAVLNIILDPILIFGFKMGVKGAALATVISQAASAIWVVSFLLGEKSHLKLKLSNLRLSPKIILPSIALGLAPFIMQSTESLLTIAFNTSLLKYGGDLAVGAMTILASVMQFSMLPLVGLTQGATPIISYNYGAGNRSRVKDTFMLLLKVSMVYSVVVWAMVQLSPQVFAGLFTQDAALIEITVKSLRVFMAASLVFGIQISCQQTFIALGNAKTSVFLALLRKIILLIPLIFILPYFLTDQVRAVFLAEPLADVLAVSVTALLFRREFKSLMARMDEEEKRANYELAKERL